MALSAPKQARALLFVRWSHMKILRSCVAGLAAFIFIGPALAGQTLEIQVDKSRSIEMPGTPGAIVIGNPAIADVTTHGNRLFIHGRNFGETSLMVLDLQGNTIMDYNLITRHVNENAVAVFKSDPARGASRQSYSCYPLCDGDMQVGDDLVYFKSLMEAASDKTEFATGSETSEAKAPAAPQ
jgi:hypothetical protein